MSSNQRTKIVLVSGGFFQGKSLISLGIASQLKFSGVITTDMIRNVLKINYPEQIYLSSLSYLWHDLDLIKQVDKTSNTIQNLLLHYMNNMEHVVVEGIHFSKQFMKWAEDQSLCRICVNNILPLSERVLLKSVTRSRFRATTSLTSSDEMIDISTSNINNSRFIKDQDDIEKFHKTIMQASVNCGFELIEYDDIDIGIQKSVEWVRQWYNL